jgi:putative DNA primase/helicase
MLSGAMRELPGVALAQPPRMADFARWAAAASEALGYGADSFERIYRGSFERQTEEVVSSDSVAVAVREFVAEKGKWTGTAAALLSLLNDRNEGAGKGRDSDWPKRAADLGKRLRVLTPTLREVGLTIDVNPSHKFGREFTITDPAALAAGAGSK